jgi:nucleoside-diphosphate-sugar epimerase
MSSGVERFVFSSTCSNYGKMEGDNSFVTESSPLAPVSHYAELKVRFEEYLLQKAKEGSATCITALRFATVYGLSSRMRFDLTVNEFTKEIALGRKMPIYGEQFWRPYCHVSDFSNAFRLVLSSKRDLVEGEVFNVGDTSQNYTKKMVVEEILKQIPSGQIEYVEKNEDPRDYRVDFSKIKDTLGFAINKTVPDGIAEISGVIKAGVFTNPDDAKYKNI